MKILNVTPAEFSEIQQMRKHVNAGTITEGDFIRHMVEYYQCESYEKYHIRVRKDVPYIPFRSIIKEIEVKRIEEE